MTELEARFRQGFALHLQGRLDDAESVYQEILRQDPRHADSLHLSGVVALQTNQTNRGINLIIKAVELDPHNAAAHNNLGAGLRTMKRHAEAIASFNKAVALKPDYAEAYNNRGTALRDMARYDEAIRDHDTAIAIQPNYADAYYRRGNVLGDLERYEEAVESYDKAIALNPRHAESHGNRGGMLRHLNRRPDAIASFDNAIAINAHHAQTHYNRGIVLEELTRYEDAILSYDKAIDLRPHYAEAYYNRGNVLQNLKRYEEAIASYDKAIASTPNFAEAYNNRGNVLRDLERHVEAIISYDKATDLKPDYAEAYYNRGNALRSLRRFDDALLNFNKAITLKPDHARAFHSLGNLFQDLGRHIDAVASYDKAISLQRGYAEAYNNRGNSLRDLQRHDEAIASYDQALAANPDDRSPLVGLVQATQSMCDWARTAAVLSDAIGSPGERKPVVPPFMLLSLLDDPSSHLKYASEFVRHHIGDQPRPMPSDRARHHDRIRIAYLSADFNEHAVAYLVAGLIEAHDRSRFEVIGISFGRDDRSEIRGRLINAFDQFHDVNGKSDLEVAELLNRLEIDIAVDLTGHTKDSRPWILAHRPASLQVSYLGYPGTMGAGFIDYIIADDVVLPDGQERCYTENIVRLPECYQVNDSKRIIGERSPTRSEHGLPERGFVFCCFNNNHKFSAPVFDVWMRLLKGADRSVLWLLRDNAAAEANLRKAAAVRGVDPNRLIFADRVPVEDHLARHRQADLFLDTLPFNAHTTASDALWAGLPVVTCRGQAFAGRVAASLLAAAGLPELVTDNLLAYETLAARLAADERLLGAIRERLARDRLTCPLFDTDRFRRHLESAYLTMWDRWRRGEPPSSFRVTPH